MSDDSGPQITPRLGLVCITASDEVRYRTITRKRLLQFTTDQQRERLRELYAENLERLDRALSFCQRSRLSLYRMTSALLPFADEPVGERALEEFEGRARQIGERASALGIRLVLHPDQFVVLSSDSEQVIENSLKILRMHARTMDMLGQPRTAWAAMQLHGGKSGRAERLVRVIGSLPEEVRSRLALENDERAYGAREILEVCSKAGVPMVFDAHHHVVKERLDSYDDRSVGEMLEAARATWPRPEWQLVHISNGRASFGDPRHNDFISWMPSAYRAAPWIEVEAKLKEQAIDRLRREWLDGLRGRRGEAA